MTQPPYNIVREACVKANHEIRMCIRCEATVPIQSDFCHDGLAHVIQNRPIHLADVLLAIEACSMTVKGLADDKFVIYDTGLQCLLQKKGKKWNLRHDSLEWHRDNQPETVEWLAGLLTNS